MDTKKQLWVDDLRIAPDDWLWAKTAFEAIELLKTKQISEISLDHDLGDDEKFGTGYTVAKFIEESAFYKTIEPLKWRIHSANPIGRARMLSALRNADRYWSSDASSGT